MQAWCTMQVFNPKSRLYFAIFL